MPLDRAREPVWVPWCRPHRDRRRAPHVVPPVARERAEPSPALTRGASPRPWPAANLTDRHGQRRPPGSPAKPAPGFSITTAITPVFDAYGSLYSLDGVSIETTDIGGTAVLMCPSWAAAGGYGRGLNRDAGM